MDVEAKTKSLPDAITVEHVDKTYDSADVSQAIDDRRLIRRIDLCLCPMLALSMALQYIDKQALPAASILGIIKDLHLHGNEYSWSNSIFYFGYLAFTYLVPYLMVKFPIGKVLSWTFVSWAVVVGAHAALKDFGGLMAVRFFLGVAEAAIAPGCSLILGMWYKREEHALRHGYWYLGTSTGIVLSGFLSFGVAHVKKGLGAWRWLFIALAVISVFWAALMFYLLPDTPANARWLSNEQRKRAVERVRTNQMALKRNTFRWHQFWEAISDFKVWLVTLYVVALTICNSSITAFAQIVLLGLGFDVYQTNLFNIALGGLSGFFAVSATYTSSRIKNMRSIVCIVLCCISLVGSILVRFGPNLGSKLFGFLIFYAYPCTVAIALSLVASNVAGYTKKTVATAMVFVGYCTGNIIGPFLFFAREKPKYPSGFNATSICFGAAVVLMSTHHLVVRFENNRRDRLHGRSEMEPNEEDQNHALDNDLTDRENFRFRYMT